jgi:hypothetical protein
MVPSIKDMRRPSSKYDNFNFFCQSAPDSGRWNGRYDADEMGNLQQPTVQLLKHVENSCRLLVVSHNYVINERILSQGKRVPAPEPAGADALSTSHISIINATMIRRRSGLTSRRQCLELVRDQVTRLARVDGRTNYEETTLEEHSEKNKIAHVIQRKL